MKSHRIPAGALAIVALTVLVGLIVILTAAEGDQERFLPGISSDDEPAENHFIAYYQGSCPNCHSLDSATGEMGVKSGPKNW